MSVYNIRYIKFCRFPLELYNGGALGLKLTQSHAGHLEHYNDSTAV